MRKKQKKGSRERHLSKAGICFEALEPRLLLSGSWGAVVDGPGADTQVDSHGSLTQGSMVFHADTGITGVGSEDRSLTPGSSRVDLLSLAPAFNTPSNPVPALDASPASIPAAPATDHTTAMALADNKAAVPNPDPHADILDAAMRRELVFVNDNVAAYEILINGIRESDTIRAIEIVVLDADRDGIQQVSDILAQRSDLSAVHVIAHGSDGQINLGNYWLNSTTLQQKSDAVAGWGGALTDTGDILFYGCSVASNGDGQSLLDDIAGLTGADVIASDDPTGHEAFGGDWELEYTAGTIETGLSINEGSQESWTHVLAPPVATDDPSSYTNSVLDLNPLHYWRLGESSGTTATDLGSAAIDGTYAGSVTLGATGALTNDTDTAADFNGTTDYVDVGNFNVAGSGITLTAWFNADDFGTTDQRIISKAHSSPEADHTWMLSTFQSGGEYRLRFRVDAGGTTNTLIASSGSITAGQWHHAAATYDAASGLMTLYLDGVEVGSMTHFVGGAVTGSTDNVYIGANPEGAGLYGVFDGRIDEVAVFEQALTSSEILALSLSDQVNNYVVNEDTTLTITAANGVLANDADLDGDSLTAILNTDVSNGTLTLNADGSFSYTPNADWNGTDSFTYTANDGLLDSNVASVTITVNPVNDAPTLNNGGLASVAEDTANPAGQTVAIIFSGQFSDMDGDGFGGIAVVGNPADAGTQGTWQYSTNGGTNWFAIGTVADDSTALALGSSSLVRFLPVADYNGTPPALTVRGLDDTYVGGYSTTAGSETRINVDTISNGGPTAIAAATASLSTSVTPVNDAPVGLPTISGVVTENQMLSVDTSGISDIDGLGVFSYQWLRNGAAIGGATGSTYTLGDADVGTQISVQVSYSDGDGAAESVTSLQTAAVVNVNDAPAARDDRIGLVFDGIDDYVTIGAYAGLSVSTNLTMEAWIKPTGLGSGSQIVINKEGEYELGITADTGEVKWAFDNIDPNWSWHNTGYFAEAGEWTHLAVTYNNGVVETYANGVLVDTYSGSGAIADQYPAMNELQIGGRENATTQRFDGFIDEVRIWNTTRNQIEIQTTMNTLLTGAESGLIGNWRLDEGSGTTVADQSSLNHDGTLADGVVAAEMPVWKGYVVIEDGTLTVNAANGVLSNDFDIDGDILSAVLDSGPANADSFTLNPDGSFTYTPNADFNGIDSFTYHANDGSADSNIATVTIRVDLVNDAPLLSGANDLTAINEDPVSNNGTLVSNLIAGQITDVDAGSLSGIAVTGVDDTNGTWQYTTNSGGLWTDFVSPSESNSRLLAADASTYVRFVPNADWNGTVTNGITFRAWDQTIGTAGGTVDLTRTVRDEFTTAAYSNNDGTANWATDWIETDTSDNIRVSGQQLVMTPANIGDSIYRQADLTGATSATLSFDYTNGLAGAKRIDLQISDDGGSSFTTLATFSSAINSGSGTFNTDVSSFIAGDTQIRFYFTGTANGVHSLSVDNVQIQYAVNDVVGGTTAFSAATASSSITVTAVADLTAVDDSFTTAEDTALVESVATNDSTTSGGSLSYAVDTDVTSGTLVLNNDGSFTYTPAANFNGADSFSYTVTDAASGESSTQSVTLTVTAVNDVPVAAADSYATNEDTAVTTGDVLTNDALGDPATTITAFDAASANGGLVVNNGDGTFTYTPAANFNGIDSFTYTITDNDGETSTATVTITVTAVADLTAVDDSFTTAEDTALVESVATNDSTTSGGSLSYAVDTDVTSGTLVLNNDGSFTYTPAANFNGADSFSYTVTDAASGESSTQSVTLTVTAVNDVPVAAADSYATNEDTAVTTGDVLTNDALGDPATTITAFDAASANGGLVVNNGDGTFTYTPAANFNGIDSFTYTITDNDGETSTATVTITVTAVADLTAVDDSFTTAEDTALVESVATNDSTTSGGSLSYAVDTDVTSGTLVLNNDGSFTYTPAANFNGADSFSYTVTDAASGESSTQSVTLTVTAVNDVPVAAADSYATNEDTAVTTGDVLTNDALGDPATTITAFDAASANGGLVVNNGDGTFTYTPAANFNGIDSFTYTITDNDGETSTATVTITVTAVADLTAVDDSFTTAEDTALVESVATNDSTTSGGSLSYAVDTDVTSGTLVLNNDGSFTYTPAANFNGADSFSYTVTDAASGESSTQSVTLTVTAVNDVPVAAADSYATNEDTAVTTGDVLTNDALGDPATTITAFDAASANGGLVVNNGDGTFTYTPAANFNGIDSFTYTITDNDGETSTATVTITVTAVADLTAVDDSFTTAEDTALVESVATNDSTTSGGSLSYAVDTDVTSGTLVLNNDGSFTYTPAANFNGADSFSYTVTDAASGESSTQSVTLTVTAVNDVPVAAADSYATNEDTAVTTGDVLTNDALGDPATTITAFDAASANGGLVVNNGDGTFTYTPAANFNGIDSFTYTITDNDGETSTATVTITVTAVADLTAVDDSFTTAEDTALVESVATNDSTTSGGSLSYAVDTDVTSGTLVLNNDGSFTYTPAANFNGADSFSYTVTDAASGESSTQSVTLTVTAVNDVPVAAADSYATNEDTAVTTGDVLTNDALGDPATTITAFDAASANGGLVVNNGDGTFTYTPAANFNGIDSFTYTITDNDGETSTATVTITVTAVADLTAVDDSFTTAEDTALVESVATNDSTTSGGSLSYAVDTDVTSGTLVLNNDGSFTYTPAANFNGADSFSYTVTDAASGESSTQSVTLTVTAVNDVPVAAADSYATNEDTAVTTGDVLTNDALGDPATTITAFDAASANGGLVVNNGDGTFTYTPAANFNGIDSFTYTITDNDGETSTATVTITVTAVADLTAVDDSFTTAEDTALVESVATNDSTTSGGSLSYAVDTDVTSGTLVLNNDGSFTYTPAANFNGADSFSYTVTDAASGESSTQSVTLTVTAVNDVPVAAADSYATNEDTAVTTGDVLTNDALGDPATTITAFDAASANGGLVVNNGDGTFTYTPAANFNGIDSFTYTITDNDGETSTATVTITVTAVADLTAVDDSFTTAEDTALVESVATNDSTTSGGSLSYAVDTDVTSGTLVLNNDGSFTYTPAANFNGADSFSYTVTDAASGESSTQSVTLTVTAVNDVPVAAADSYATNEDTAVTTGDVLTNDALGDPATTITAFDAASANGGLVVNNGDGTFTYTPAANFNGIDSFTYTITDNDGETSTATVTITVTAVADLTAVDDSFTTAEDTALVESVATNDSTTSGGSLSYAVDTDVTSGTLVLNNDGSFTYTPAANFNGADSFSYTVTDAASGESSTQSVTLTVTAVNDVPVAAADSYATNEDTAVTTGDVLTNDALGDPATTITAFDAASANGGLVVNNGDGTFTYTPAANFNGIDSFTYTITDNDGETSTATVTITVTAVADSVDDTATTDEDNEVTTNVLANDSFVGAPVVTSITQGANGTVVNNGDGTVTYTPGEDFNGTDSYTYTVTSGGVTETATVDVTVNAVADVADDTIVTNEDTAGVINVLTNDTFGAGATVTGVTDGANGMVAFLADGTVTYTPAIDFNGTDSFTYTVTTAAGDTETATVTVTVNAVADDGGDSDPGPGPGVDPIEPDPEPDPDGPPDEIPPIEDELPPREELAVSDIPSSKLPIITPLQWADPTYFVPTISMLTTDNMLAADDGAPSTVVSTVKRLQRELASETIDRVASNVSALFSANAMTQTLDHIQQQLGDTLEMDGKRGKLIIGAATGLGASVFAGYVIWALRGSSLLLGALTAMPMWRCFDPLPVLMGYGKKRKDRDETKSSKSELDKDETTVKELLGEKQVTRDVGGSIG